MVLSGIWTIGQNTVDGFDKGVRLMVGRLNVEGEG